MRFCEECGAKIEDGAIFCEECGTTVDPGERQMAVMRPVSEVIESVVEESEATETVVVESVVAETIVAAPEVTVPISAAATVEEQITTNPPAMEMRAGGQNSSVQVSIETQQKKRNKLIPIFIALGTTVVLLIAALIVVIAVVIPKVKENSSSNNRHIANEDKDKEEKKDSKKNDNKNEDKNEHAESDEDDASVEDGNQVVEAETEVESETENDYEQEADYGEEYEGNYGEEYGMAGSDPLEYGQPLRYGFPLYYYNYGIYYDEFMFDYKVIIEINSSGSNEFTVTLKSYDRYDYQISSVEGYLNEQPYLDMEYSGTIYDEYGQEHYVAFTICSDGGVDLYWVTYYSDYSYTTQYEGYMSRDNNEFLYY